MQPAYRYRVSSIVRVIDGDTLICDLDLGFKVHAHLPIRVRGINCPELPSMAGWAAKQATETLLAAAQTILLESYKDQQTFARWVADVYVDGVSLADLLRELGHA